MKRILNYRIFMMILVYAFSSSFISFSVTNIHKANDIAVAQGGYQGNKDLVISELSDKRLVEQVNVLSIYNSLKVEKEISLDQLKLVDIKEVAEEE